MISPINYCFEATVNLTLGHNFQGCRLEGVGEGNPPAVMMNTDASTLVINIFRKTECTKNCAAVTKCFLFFLFKVLSLLLFFLI